MRRIAFANQKGGVGKTTCCVNLSAALAEAGKKVLLVDIDPQANASIHLGVEVHSLRKSVYDVLLGEASVDDALLKGVRGNLDCLPSNIDLSGAEVELATSVGREVALRNALDEHMKKTEYDFVMIDCPPSLGVLSINGLCAAEEVFLTVQTEYFALQGISKLMEVVSLVRRRLNPRLHISGVIPTMVDMRTNLSREVLEDIRSFFEKQVFNTVIRQNVRLAEAPGFGKTILEYDPNCYGSQDFRSLADEVLSRRRD